MKKKYHYNFILALLTSLLLALLVASSHTTPLKTTTFIDNHEFSHLEWKEKYLYNFIIALLTSLLSAD